MRHAQADELVELQIDGGLQCEARRARHGLPYHTAAVVIPDSRTYDIETEKHQYGVLPETTPIVATLFRK